MVDCARDIPMPLVTSGVEYGNLRELALARMRDFGTTCRDVRTREVGIVDIHSKVRPDQVRRAACRVKRHRSCSVCRPAASFGRRN